MPNDNPATEHVKGEDGKCTNCGAYIISNADELKTFAEAVNNGDWSANAVLTANITVNENVLKDDGTLADDTSGFTVWKPIGFRKYTGTFDGQNHTISGLYVSDADTNFLGLFGYVENGSISNVGIVDSYFSGNQHIGGICGSNNGGTFTNCHNASTVIGSYTGGICGTNKGTITNCSNAGVVGAENSSVGGICGYNQDSTVTNCYNEGTVNGKGWVGGICGYSNAIITDCHNTGTVNGTGSSVGGVCGNNSGGTITNGYNTGTVTGGESSTNVGGVCGYINGGTFTNSYNQGLVSGKDKVGGVCGRNGGTTENCYNIGSVTGVESSTNIGGVCGYNSSGTTKNCYNTGSVTGGESSTKIGGLCGYNSSGSFSNCYYLAESETDSIDGTAFKNAKQFASGEVAYLLNGKTSEGELAWGQTIGTDDYPVFNNGTNTVCATTGCVSYNNAGNEGENPHTFDENGQCTVCGAYEPTTDTDDDGCYEIGNAGQLYWFAGLVNRGNNTINAVLTADITVNQNVLNENGELNEGSFKAWTPFGSATSRYTGTFDGAGHTISGLYFSDTEAEYVGLVGYVGENGTVCNVGVVDSYFSGNMGVGGVCGWNSGGVVTNCYADVTVNGSQSIGGVCGHNSGIITNCYSTSKVSGTTTYGGVCGFLIRGTIINCYYDKLEFTGNAVGYQTDGYTVTDVYGITSAQFESGMVAYNLLQGCKVGSVTYDGSIWGQTIGTDKYPVLGGAKVYATKGCVSYNNDGEEGEKEHNIVDGKCTACGTYVISTAEQLFSFAAAVNSGNNEIDAVLAADITVNEGVLDADGNLNSGEFDAWTPIGNETYSYNGTFDGAGHTISGLYFNDTNTSDVGLFGYVGENGVVSNVGVTDFYFNGAINIGGLCGGNDGKITNCFVRGTVYGGTCVGGLCAANYGEISNCYAVATVSNVYYSGSFCGDNDGKITNCCVYGGNAIGSGNGTSDNVFSKTIAQFKSGEVAYLLNQNDGTDDDVWGQTIGTDDYPVLGGAKVYVTTGCVTYTNNAELNGTEKEHGEFVNGICPDCGEYKAAEEINGVYQIGTVTDLYWFAQAVNRGNNTINAVLTADITVNQNVLNENGGLSEGSFKDWTPIGDSDNNQYNGTFDGAGHTISGLYFNDTNTSNVGLFGYVGGNGVVSNVGIVDSYINANEYVGGICGDNYGGVINCYSTGAVNGSQSIGGVCGYNGGEITNCYYDSTVYGGGAIGYDDGTAQNVLGKTTAQFTRGEVCYLLNGDQSNLYWGQTIGTDKYPTAHNDNNTVYATTGCVTYSNDAELSGTAKEHPEFVNGICPDCGEYKAAEEINGVYQIGTVTDLYWFAAQVNGGNNTINAVLTADITVNQNVLKSDGTLNSGVFEKWTPIGDYDNNQYNGTFDGAGHTISGLYFNNTSAYDIGFIGCVGENGVVTNVGIVDSYINANEYVGGICGDNCGKVINCYFTGTVSSSNDIGGLCGYNEGEITNCYSVGKVSGTDYVGGLCGYNYGTLTNCYYDSTVFGGSAIGYENGTSDNVLGKTTAKFKSGEVCYLLNQNDTIADDVWGQTIGRDDYPVFNDGTNTVYVTTGCVIYTNNAELIGKEKEHGEFVNGMCPDCGEFTAAVQNAETGVYEISNAGQLYWFADQVNSGNNTINAVLTADITVNENVLKSDGTLNSGEFDSWTPIGDYSNGILYNGTFDGAGHTISGLYFNNTSASIIGFIGCVGNNGVVSNVGIVDSYINANEYVGGICGGNLGKVINCYNTGVLSGEYNVGGLCGVNGGAVTNCYYDSAVYGGNAIGSDDGTAQNVLGKTTAQFTRGEVCYLLNQNDGIENDVWGQNIGTDKAPVLGGEKVYKITYKNGDSEYEADYANAGEFELPVSSLKGFVAYSDNTDYLFAGQKVQIESDTSFNIVTLTINMMNGASMRMNEKTGIRFYSQIDTDLITALRNAAENAGATISLGTMISKKSIIGEQDFTKNMSGQLADVKYKAKTWYSEDEFTGMVGSIVSIKESNYNEEFVGRGYVTVTCGDVSTTVYADYNGNSISNNSRSICYIANQIMLDQTEYEALSTEKQQLVKDFADRYTGEDKYNQ